MSDFKSNALRYARNGIAVFPVHGIKDGNCACFKGAECGSPGKHPITKNGFKDASTDAAKIEHEWGSLYPNANLGIACGLSGLYVIDIDPKNDGMATMKNLVAEIPSLRNAWIVKTGSGGYHYIYAARPDIPLKNTQGDRGGLGPGVDTRGYDGYIVAAPSDHISGGVYTWKRKKTAQPPPVPFEIIERLTQPTTDGGGSSEPGSVQEMIPPGERHQHFLSLAGAMRARGSGEATILSALRADNQARCNPVHDDDDLVRIAKDYATKDVSNVRYGFASDLQKQEDSVDPNAGKKRLILTAYSDIKEEDIDWLWFGRIAYGKFTLIVGHPGKGKSYFTDALAAHVSTGRALPDHPFALSVASPQSVLMLTYEDGQGDTIKPRLRKCGADMSRIFTIDHSNGTFSAKDIPALIQTLKENPDIRIITIDPVQSMMVGVDENSDGEIRQTLQPLIDYALNNKIAVVGIKHLNKDESKSIDSRVGGSIGWMGLARSVLLVGHDNEKEFEAGHTYGGITSTKGNLAGAVPPITYEINDNGFIFGGTDTTITVERLLPRPPERKKAA